jgi:hypothetical protein
MDGAMIRCAPSISWVPGGSAVTLFDARDGSYHALNESGSAIWTALGDGQQPDEIARTIAEAHRASPEQVRQDIQAFVALALDKGLLVSD